ncbi:hypothetical protein [Streptomyces sp. NPDC020747]|uniref:hypothetical protein n=1 Tax=Streptomyces sp. NPDC020747 TaxID=3365086 RepID=UPI003792E4CA
MATVAQVFEINDLTGMPDGPLPDRDAIDNWSPKSFDDYFTAEARHRARGFAQRAVECEVTGAGVREWHSCREAAVLSLLAAAEETAPAEDRPWHADRVDAYAELHGLRGWYRHTSQHGKHRIQINYIRRRQDADQDRHFVHTSANYDYRATPHWVVDRDTGRTVYRSHSKRIAQQWIEAREAS